MIAAVDRTMRFIGRLREPQVKFPIDQAVVCLLRWLVDLLVGSTKRWTI